MARGLITIAVLLLAVTVGAADSVWVSGRPLQVNLDRLYLSHGQEERIFPGSRFVVHRGSDSVYSGCVEFAWTGVSASFETTGFFDTLNLHELHVWMQRAPLDTTTSITIGYTGHPPASDSLGHNRVIFRQYESQFEMSLDFESGTLDAFLSYHDYNRTGPHSRTITHPAPFFIALVPNTSADVTSGGILTTSLYYRLDIERPSLYFSGDAVQPFCRLRPGGEKTARPFPYDPARGRTLLTSLRDRPREIAIGTNHPVLDPTASYFADILSRDRFKTRVVSSERSADICIITVPLTDDPLVSLHHIHDHLTATADPEQPAAQTLNIIGDYLESAENAADSSSRIRYIQLAEQSLRDDIGVFALFRPTRFFNARQNILGSPFESDGRLDFNRLQRVHLPIVSEDCRP